MLKKPVVYTDGMQGHVEMLRRKRLSLQAAFDTQTLCQPLDTHGGILVRPDREE